MKTMIPPMTKREKLQSNSVEEKAEFSGDVGVKLKSLVILLSVQSDCSAVYLLVSV